MLIINIITLACLIAFLVEIFLFFYGFKNKSHGEQVTYVRGFKKGKFLAVYITAFPLYFIGILHSGATVIDSVFLSIHRIVNLVVLKYEIDPVISLMQSNAFYRGVMYFCFVIAGVNAAIFAFSLFVQQAWCALQRRRAVKTDKNKLYIFGNNPQNIAIYHSDKTRSKAIIDDIPDDEREKLYLDHVVFISTASPEGQIQRFINNAKKLDREYVFIVNTGNEEKNIQLCTYIINEIDKAPDYIQEKIFLTVKVFVFGDPRYQAIYEDIISSGFGCIHYESKYQKMAIDFIDRYPLSLFMNGEQIDYSSSLVKKDVDINVALIGFGQTNQQIFLTSVANNQFLTEGEQGPVLKQVKYFIFDKDFAENNKNLNHSYYRFKHECAECDPDKYLPMPAVPAEERYYHLDINSKNFYNEIRGIVERSERDANFIVIAFGSDLENLDMAQKLVEKRKEWNLKNLVIFVKVRVWHKEQTLLEENGCYFIGNESDCVYNIDTIVGDKLYKMAKMRNETYALEYVITNNPKLEITDEYLEKQSMETNSNWFKIMSQMERESSLYGGLSLRSKLNLMGLDYCPVGKTDIQGLTEEEYIQIYASDDKPIVGNYPTVRGKKIICYGLDFKDSRRRNMAIHEHQRWNSFMISKGMIPSSKEQILTERIVDKNGKERFSNGRNYSVRRHGNLTTFDGLLEFRKMVAERDRVSELQTDVIKYDYQILDDAHWLLSNSGYKIIRKSEHNRI